MCKIIEVKVNTRTGERVGFKVDGFKPQDSDDVLEVLKDVLGQAPEIVEQSEEYHKPHAVQTIKQGS